jgi:lysophospholipase L1-like esterase
MKKTLFAIVLAALLAAAPVTAEQLDFTIYVALGDSLTAGFASGGLTQYYQERSYPAVFAGQTNAFDFQQPIVSDPGIPPVFELLHLVPGPVLSTPDNYVPGSPINPYLARPYNNLGVVGSTLFDMVTTTGDINNLLAGNTDNAMHDIVLRFPSVEVYMPDPFNPPADPCDESQWVAVEMETPAIVQALSMNPTILTMWIGNNDVLGAAYYATPIEGVTMTPASTFGALYASAMEAVVGKLFWERFMNPCGLDNLGPTSVGEIVVMTLPDVTAIPFVTSIAPYLDVPGLGHVPLIGSLGPLPEGEYIDGVWVPTLVTLGASGLLAQGIGIPVELGGTGIPLPEDLFMIGSETYPGVVLRPAEVAAISQRIDDFNTIIRSTVAAHNAAIHEYDAGYEILVLDIHEVFDGIVAGDFPTYGGIDLNTGFLTGGIFSFDGIHAQNIGYAFVAELLIDLLNDHYNAGIPQVNMHDVLFEGGADAILPEGMAKDVIFSQEAFLQLRDAFPLLGDPRPVAQVDDPEDVTH